MRTIYKCENNAMNYVVMTENVVNKYCVVCWDCSEEEINKQIYIITTGFNEKDFDGEDWKDGDILTAMKEEGFTGFEEIAWSSGK